MGALEMAKRKRNKRKYSLKAAIKLYYHPFANSQNSCLYALIILIHLASCERSEMYM